MPVLTSQPLRELFFTIPTDILTADGIPRAVAKKAFTGDIPEEIIARKHKGAVNGFYTRFFKQNERYLRELLLDGLLVKNGILDRSRLEKYFAAGRYGDVFPSSEIATSHFTVETWAQSWTSGVRHRAAA